MFINDLNEQERYLYAHISDLAKLSARSGTPRFSAFLNEREAVIAGRAADDANALPVFYGGYDGALRTVCGFTEGTYAEGMSPEDVFGVSAVTFTFRERDKLSHRDFLGAVLALGIKRSTVGDILVGDGKAVVFCLESAADMTADLTRIGKAGVKAVRGITGELPIRGAEKKETTVSSLRLDCVVGACTGISREKSASLVKSGQVSTDFSVCTDVSAGIGMGCVLSIRGFGRYRLAEVLGETKKGRVRVIVERFI